MAVLLSVWTGKPGNPVADVAKLVVEVLSVEQTPITFAVKGADGTLKVGPSIEANLAPVSGCRGLPTALHDALFTSRA